MPSNYGIIASSYSKLPTFLKLYGQVDTTIGGITTTSSDEAASGDNFEINVDYQSSNQNVILRAALTDLDGLPLPYQSVYFLLTSGGSTIQIGTSSLESGSSSSLFTDEYGEVSKTFTSTQWINNDYQDYSIKAVFDGTPEWETIPLAPSESGTGYLNIAAS